MQITANHRFPAGVEEVFRALTDPECLAARYQALGHLEVVVLDRHESHGRLLLCHERTVQFPVTGDALQVLVPEPRVHQVDTWEPRETDGSRRGTYELTAPNLPVRAGGTRVLRPDGPHGCLSEIVVDITCDVPIIGGRIAAVVAEAARRLIDEDGEATEAALRAGRPARVESRPEPADA